MEEQVMPACEWCNRRLATVGKHCEQCAQQHADAIESAAIVIFKKFHKESKP